MAAPSRSFISIRERSRWLKPAALSSLFFCMLALARSVAAADPPPAPPQITKRTDSAFTLFYERAVAAYQAGQYAAAIEDLLVAYRLQPEPRILYNIAQSHRKLGDFRQAKQFFTQYLDADKEISPEMKGEIERYIAELSEQERIADAQAAKARPIDISATAKPTPNQTEYKVPRWQKALGAGFFITGAPILISGLTFLALDGKCTEPPVPPAVECGRLYQVTTSGATQTAIGSALLIAGTLTFVIPYALSKRPPRTPANREGSFKDPGERR